jgi:hypothetical protein
VTPLSWPAVTGRIGQNINSPFTGGIRSDAAGGFEVLARFREKSQMRRGDSQLEMTGVAIGRESHGLLKAESRLHVVSLLQPVLPHSFGGGSVGGVELERGGPFPQGVLRLVSLEITLTQMKARQGVLRVRAQNLAKLGEGGRGAAYALVAGALNSLLSGREVLHAEQVDLNQTMNVTAWRGKDGMIRILAANLEEGLCDDADMTRRTILVLPESWKATSWTDI